MIIRSNYTKYLKLLDILIYSSLIAYAIGLVTSISILGLAHILIVVPCIYFAINTNWKRMPRSSWGLLLFVLAVILSVFINLDIMKNGMKPVLKTKYFLLGFLSIVPFYYFITKKLNNNKVKWIIVFSLLASLIALIGGTIGKNTGYNPILLKNVNMDRNAGLMGMVLNYAHNLAYFLTIFSTILIAFWSRINSKHKLFFISILLLNVFALYTTYTRGAIIAFIAGLLGYYLKDLKKFLLAFIILIVVGVSGYFLNFNDFQRENSNLIRFSLWKTAIAAYIENPVFGWGYLNFEQHSIEIKNRHNFDFPIDGGHAHNSILEVMASTGTVGLVAFFVWIGLWVSELFRRNDIWSRVELAALCAFFVGGLTQSTIGLGINLFFIMFVYSISAANTLRQSEVNHA